MGVELALKADNELSALPPFRTFGEGRMDPRLRLRMVIHNSPGPFPTLRLMKQVMMAMYNITT